MIKKQNIPKLRFPEFQNAPEWEGKKLEEICKFQQGVQVDLELQSQKPKNNFVRFIRIENYTQQSSDFRYIPLELASNKSISKDEIAIVRYGATAGYIGRGLDGVLANNLFKLAPNQKILNTCYLFHFLKREQTFKFFQAEMAGGAMPALSFGIVGFLKVPYASLAEQQKISSCLSSLDELITALAEKVEALKTHKKALMQQLFPREGESIPRLRFPEFQNAPEWVEKTLGDVGKVSMCKRIMKDETTETGEIPFYKIGTFGKKADAYIDKELYEDYRKKYSFPKKGDILISASGTIGRLVVYDGHPAYFQDSNIVWIDNNEELVKNSFLSFFYETVKWTTEDTTIARLYNDNLRSVQILIPSNKQEQQKIADCLSSLDELITAQAEKVEALKTHKKSLMQQLFPVKCEGV